MYLKNSIFISFAEAPCNDDFPECMRVCFLATTDWTKEDCKEECCKGGPLVKKKGTGKYQSTQTRLFTCKVIGYFCVILVYVFKYQYIHYFKPLCIFSSKAEGKKKPISTP